ncbi:MAG: DNA polymerase III subunit delta' [Candidatus Omnitrophica bacterium]|nr:DNA polymerase III subunit delta' [Candidatus Omnitrophota bacterium]
MSFKDIKGQEKPINFLKESIKGDYLAGAYLFLGPDGVGKAMVAKTLAKALNCLEEQADACEKCPSCIKIEKNQHPDVHFVASIGEEDDEQVEAIKIEDIRLLQRQINLRPFEGKKKVFIINNAHQMTAESANALLKILEEPPKNSLIILISSKSTRLFKTIVSRCRMIKFSPLPRKELEVALKNEYHLAPEQAHFYSFFAEGRLGMALALKDTNIFNEKNLVIDQFISVNHASLDNLAAKDKESLRGYLNLLVVWLRDIYLLKSGLPHGEIINLDRKEELLKLMGNYSFSELDEALKFISRALLYLEQNVNAKLIFANLKSYMKG